MTVDFYNYDGEPRNLNKVLGNPMISVNAEYLPGSSILQPKFRITWQNSIAVCNYVRVLMFNRWYFITDIQADNGGAAIVTCRVDVLKTYSNYLLNTPAIVTRSERKGQKGSAKSTFIVDPKLPRSPARDIKVVEFQGSDLNIDTASMTSNNFVLNVAGGGAIS